MDKTKATGLGLKGLTYITSCWKYGRRYEIEASPCLRLGKSDSA
jgi:hypothetical protein